MLENNDMLLETVVSCFDSDIPKLYFAEVGRQLFWIKRPSTLLIAPRSPDTLCLSTLLEFESSGRKGMLETHKSATSLATIFVLIFSTYCRPSVIYGDATLSRFDASCRVRQQPHDDQTS